MRKLLVLFCMLPSFAFADAPAGMKKVGSASLHKFFAHIYDATLYAPNGSFDSEKPHALELTYRMDFTSKELVDHAMDDITHAQKVSAEDATRWRAELLDAIPDMKENDALRVVVAPRKSMQFFHNGKQVDTVKDVSLIAPLTNIWLGEKSSETSMRDKLLGKK